MDLSLISMDLSLIILCLIADLEDTRAGVAVRQIRATKRNEYAGALGGIRTPDPQIRSLVLYPAELRARAAGTIFALPQKSLRRNFRRVPSLCLVCRGGIPLKPGNGQRHIRLSLAPTMEGDPSCLTIGTRVSISAAWNIRTATIPGSARRCAPPPYAASGWIAAAVFLVIVLAVAFGAGHKPGQHPTNIAVNNMAPPAAHIAPITVAPPSATPVPAATAPPPITPAPNPPAQH